jgi:fermentation-respiration switch protein FrsA (DUF1100 family)
MIPRLIAAGAALTLPGAALTLTGERLIRPRVFYTGPWHPEPPDAIGWPYREASIATSDGLQLQGWFFPARDVSAPTILFMHGTSYNASDMWVTGERADAFRDFLQGIGAHFMVFDYRGYGRNPGIPTEETTYADAGAAREWILQQPEVHEQRLFYYGFSLGTGIASELATRQPPAGLILRAPFTSIRDLAIDRYGWLRWLFVAAPWLPLTNYNTLSKIRRLQCPLLVMHGDSDKTVPEYMGRRIFDAAPGPKTYASFPNSGHSDIGAHLVVPPITRFMREVLGEPADAVETLRSA